MHWKGSILYFIGTRFQFQHLKNWNIERRGLPSTLLLVNGTRHILQKDYNHRKWEDIWIHQFLVVYLALQSCLNIDNNTHTPYGVGTEQLCVTKHTWRN